MNNYTTFDESDFESVKELYELYNQEIESREKRYYLFKEVPTKNSLKEDIKKDSFYKNQGWKSIDPPRVYKLSGSVTTFDPYEIEMNDKLPQRVLNGLEKIRKEYEEALTEKDIKENPFVNSKTIIQRLCCPKCSKVNEVPKETSVFSCCECEASLSAPKFGRPMDTPITISPISIPKPPPKWEAHKDSVGDTYYYNVVTKVTQWEKPLEL
jgi:hypothetical protein